MLILNTGPHDGGPDHARANTSTTAFPSILPGTLWLLRAVGVSAQERVDFFNVDVAVGARTTARLDLAGLPAGACRCRVRGSARVIGTAALAVH